MYQGMVRRISFLLTLGLTLSCLFFLGANSCRAFLTEPHAGHYCSAEQTSTPSPIQTPDDTHMATPHKDPALAVVALPAVLIFTFVLLLVDVQTKQFVRRINETLVRYGPYKKMFLPYLLATHDL